MTERTMLIDGTRVSRFLYGTAWKEDETEALTTVALQQGFRGIDTANQRRHYHEAAVGRAVQAAIAGGLVTRADLFLQTKFTFRRGQDHRLPYDPDAPVPAQVEQSIDSSLRHFGTDALDSFLLHGPTNREGLVADDWAAWGAMEAAHDAGRTRLLGVSNVSLGQLDELCAGARVRPRFVQNRCYAARGWDRDVRAYCAANGLTYQGFSLLTGNRSLLIHPDLLWVARCYDRSAAQIVFRFALEVGMVPLTGTTDAAHMRADLDVFDFRMEPDEVELIEGLGLR